MLVHLFPKGAQIQISISTASSRKPSQKNRTLLKFDFDFNISIIGMTWPEGLCFCQSFLNLYAWLSVPCLHGWHYFDLSFESIECNSLLFPSLSHFSRLTLVTCWLVIRSSCVCCVFNLKLFYNSFGSALHENHEPNHWKWMSKCTVWVDMFECDIISHFFNQAWIRLTLPWTGSMLQQCPSH